MASGGPPKRLTPASTNCLIVGAYADPENLEEGSKAQGRQERMKESIEADISSVLKFVAKHRSRSERPGARRHRDKISVSEILLNRDMLRFLEKGLRARSGKHEMKVLDDATIKPYESKAEVRAAIRDFLRSATIDQHLLLVMTGHGNLAEIEQAFRIPKCPQYDLYSDEEVTEDMDDAGVRIPTMYPGDDLYTDEELTEDINDCLKFGQRLYILMNACYSGGMLNLWQLDARMKWVALFASAGPTLTSEWCTFEEDVAVDEDEYEEEDVADDEDEYEDLNGRKYDFFAKFFKNAKVGRPLMKIAEHVLLDTQDTVRQIRPAFVTTNPAIAGAPFLVTPADDED